MKKFNIIKLVILAGISIAAACAYGDKVAKPELPVAILSGMSLGDLLNVPEVLRTPDELNDALGKDWYAGVETDLPGDKTSILLVNSCLEYFIASRQGKQPVKENERPAYQEFGLMCQAARDAANAVSATQSYLRALVLDKKLPEILPKQLALLVSAAEYKKILVDSNKKHWADVETLKGIDKLDENRVVYKYQGGQQEISLAARGDFDKDGIEDVLITSKDSVVGGSYHSMRMFLLTRYRPDGEVVLLKEYQAF